MKVLLFTGAGASVELGISAMRRMAERFRDHLHDLSLPADVIEKIDALVDDQDKDMEHAIDIIDRLESGHRAAIEFGLNPPESEIAPFLTIRQEAEWFVQHSCEQIKAETAIMMWSRTLAAASNAEFSIATTNYDRAVEIAAARLSIGIEDGFEEFGENEYAKWRGVRPGNEITLIKLHGSTDWYRSQNDEVFKLRHPMPLFGKLQITPDGLEEHALHSALVLPSREKQVTQIPFQSIAAEFRQRAKEADIVVFLGSSLRDPHMRDVCVESAMMKPTFVISRSGDFAEGVVPEKAFVMRQGAGRFLLTTFPKFLGGEDQAVLMEAASSDEPDTTRVLDWLSTALDESNGDQARCDAIETIANANLSLHAEEIEPLLESSSHDVSTYGLGLVLTSHDRDRLIQVAEAKAALHPESKFAVEFKTLQGFLS